MGFDFYTLNICCPSHPRKGKIKVFDVVIKIQPFSNLFVKF
jgi:hypothetical protein